MLYIFFVSKGSFKSEGTGGFLLLQKIYSKSLSWAENLNKLFTVVGGKFKFSAHDRIIKGLVFCYQNCSDLLWEKIVLVIKKNLKFEAEGGVFSKNLRSLEQFIQTVKGQNNFW